MNEKVRSYGAVRNNDEGQVLCFGGTGDRTRTCTFKERWLLKPLRLPIPPPRRTNLSGSPFERPTAAFEKNESRHKLLESGALSSV